MARKVTTVLSLRDNYTAVIKKARRYTSAFDKDVQKMTARLDKASAKKHDIKVKNSAAMKALTAIEKKIAPMREVMVKVAANVQHFKNQIKPVTDTVKKISTKAWTVTVKLKDAASAGLRKLTSALKKAGTVVAVGGAALIGAGAYAVGQGMQLQGYDVAMKHYIQASNPNLATSDVEKKANDYLDFLRRNANETPFGTNEVIQAGSRAVGVTGGNTAAAQGLVKMAEDMAALTPGKTIMDAMEALADAQMGEMERLKEFNFKGTQEALKAAGGDLFKMQDATGRTLAGWFGGGAEEFSKTTAGLLSTLTGEIESQIAEAGVGMAEQLQPFLQWVISDVLPDLKAFLTIAGDNGKTGIQMLGDSLKSAYYWLKDEIPNAIETLIASFEKMKAELMSPDNLFNKILKLFNIDLTSALSGKDAAANPKAAGPAGDPVFPLKLPDVNPTDALTAFLALKGTSILSKLFTGKGLLAHGADAVKTGVTAGAAAANNTVMTMAAGNPTFGALLMKGMNAFSSGMFKYGLGTSAPIVADWLGGQNRVAAYNYTEATGQKVNEESLEGVNKVWGWQLDQWNKETSANFEAWGRDFSTIMDNFFGIKRQENGIFPDFSGGKDMPMFGTPVAQSDIDKLNAFAATLKTQPDTSGMVDAAGAITDVGDAAKYASWNLLTIISRMSQVKAFGSDGLGAIPKAAGIKRVPYDNYPALLHKGEAVLPSGEAGAYRGNGNQAGRAAASMKVDIHINGAGMDENRLASILVTRLQEVSLNMA